jgi:Uma2 family endonuclease
MADITQTRMTASEFMALPESSQPMELIHGELIVSPTPKNPHQRIVGSTYFFLRQNATSGEVIVSPMDVYLDIDTVVQPDVFWVSGENSLCKLNDDGYWHGASDLVIEVLSPSTALRDRKAKFSLYEQYGVREYWLADPDAKFLEVYVRDGSRFVRLGVFAQDDTFTSAALGGVAVSVNALIERCRV